MKIRHLCAVLGVAVAVGAVTFMQSLVATNDHQATAVAERVLSGGFFRSVREMTEGGQKFACARMALDYRPNGRVMQGPPMMAVAIAPTVDVGGLGEALTNRTDKTPNVVVTTALFAQRRLPVPGVGTELTLVGRRGAYRVRIGQVVEQDRPARGLPNMYVFYQDADAFSEDWQDWTLPTVEELAPAFMSDAGRNFDRAKALLLWAAALTALCLLVNSLFLSVEARRREIAILRMVGLTRGGVAKRVLVESLALTAGGAGLGLLGGVACLAGYVAGDAEMFPLGLAIAHRQVAVCLALAPLISIVAALVALRPALKVKPLEAASNRMPRKKHLGMLIAFACGFGAFVAVEVWGASLMSAFVPSPEWPDAIVSILPGGVSAFDIEKLQGEVKGVKRIHELAPLQVNLEPLEELKGRGDRSAVTAPRSEDAAGTVKRGGFERGTVSSVSRHRSYRNALLLGSDWLPEFRFAAGTREEAEKALGKGDNCIITAMMARARKLKLGDDLKLDCGRGLKMALRIVGIVDLNWHMVTSRGLVRGLNRMPVNTDGPVFVSFDTVEACDPRPAPMVKMTHLWLDFEPDFLAAHGAFEAGRIVENGIVEALGIQTEEIDDNTVRLHARDEIADGTLAHGVELIGAMARVPFIFILVVSLGFVAMLVASADARKREFAVLRAVGATKGQLAQILVGEALKVAGVGILFGLVGGALVGWLCTAGTRAAMANWGIPPSFAVPYLTVAKGAVGAVVFALAVAVPTSMAIVGKASRR